MSVALVDVSFLYDVAGNDTKYIYDVVNLFLNNVPDGLNRLDSLIAEGKDYSAIQKQAHGLKSSAGIIKIRGMYDSLVAIEAAARKIAEGLGTVADFRPVILKRFEDMMGVFHEALPEIVAERDRNSPVRK